MLHVLNFTFVQRISIVNHPFFPFRSSFLYSRVPKFLWVAIFAIIIYIPHVDTNVCSRFMFIKILKYHSNCLKDAHSYIFKKFKSSVCPEMSHKSCRNRTIKLTLMKSVYCEAKCLSRDREIHIPGKIHVGVFHNGTTGHCKHHQKKATAFM